MPSTVSRLYISPPISGSQCATLEFNSFDQSVTKNLPPIDVSKTLPLFSQSLSCAGPPAFDASIKADATAKAHAVISLGVAAAGTVVPPKLTDFGIFAGLDAQLDGSLVLKGNIAVSFLFFFASFSTIELFVSAIGKG